MSEEDTDQLLSRIESALRANKTDDNEFRDTVISALMDVRDALLQGAEQFGTVNKRLADIEERQEQGEKQLKKHIDDEETVLKPLLDSVEEMVRRLTNISQRQDELYEVVQPALRKAIRTVWSWASQKAREDGPLLAFIGSLIASGAGLAYWIITGGQSLPKG